MNASCGEKFEIAKIAENCQNVEIAVIADVTGIVESFEVAENAEIVLTAQVVIFAETDELAGNARAVELTEIAEVTV